MKRIPHCVAAALLTLCCAGSGALAAQVPTPPSPCRVQGLPHEVLCGRVSRALDPARPDGTTIDVHYVVVPAMARRKLPDPVFLLAGGPGQSATELAASSLPLFARLNNRRDIVFVDQRGTGRSAPLECAADERTLTLADQADSERMFTRLAQCREQLQKLPYGDLRFFTSSIAMADLDAVRAQLGAERINVVGGSYGTRAALEYLRQFPTHVRRAYLDGAAPPDMALPASFSVDGHAALQALFTACEQNAACDKAHPRLRAEWDKLLESLPRSVTVAHPLTGNNEQITLSREAVLNAVRSPLHAPAFAAALPQAVHEAAQGRFEALMGLSSLFGGNGKHGAALAMGMHFSVVCAEDVPRLAQSTDKPSADFGADYARMYQRICAQWPRGSVPADFYTMPPSPAPVLITSGGLDPVTPPRHGERVAQALGRKAVHVVVPNAGHGVMGIGCMRDVMFRFIDEADDDAALHVDASCVRHIPRPGAFAPITLEGAP
jgi:pimeloyl-ACP methyl ester carboxylesterase